MHDITEPVISKRLASEHVEEQAQSQPLLQQQLKHVKLQGELKKIKRTRAQARPREQYSEEMLQARAALMSGLPSELRRRLGLSDDVQVTRSSHTQKHLLERESSETSELMQLTDYMQSLTRHKPVPYLDTLARPVKSAVGVTADYLNSLQHTPDTPRPQIEEPVNPADKILTVNDFSLSDEITVNDSCLSDEITVNDNCLRDAADVGPETLQRDFAHDWSRQLKDFDVALQGLQHALQRPSGQDAIACSLVQKAIRSIEALYSAAVPQTEADWHALQMLVASAKSAAAACASEIVRLVHLNRHLQHRSCVEMLALSITCERAV